MKNDYEKKNSLQNNVLWFFLKKNINLYNIIGFFFIKTSRFDFLAYIE